MRTIPTTEQLQAMDRAKLAETYSDLIGYDPFVDDPSLTDGAVRATLIEYCDTDRAAPQDDELPEPSRALLRSAGPKAYIVALAASFPCLHHKLTTCGITPETWDVNRIVSISRPWSHGERLCVLFLANVWNPSYAESKKWRFDLFDFMGVADERNRRALIAWISNPVWP